MIQLFKAIELYDDKKEGDNMVKCSDCGTKMVFVEKKIMIDKEWDKFMCPKCKNIYIKAK